LARRHRAQHDEPHGGQRGIAEVANILGGDDGDGRRRLARFLRVAGGADDLHAEKLLEGSEVSSSRTCAKALPAQASRIPKTAEDALRL
jgi:hypothetical protein